MSLYRKYFLFIPIILISISCAQKRQQSASVTTTETTTQKPNILFIVVDDMGWGDVGYHGSHIRTPVIDSLANAGLKLDQHYVTPQCSPTRAALMTGYYPSRIGDHVTKAYNGKVFPDGTITMADVLKKQGYETGISGKWHLGSEFRWGPLTHGFDKAYGLLNGACTQFGHEYKLTNPETWYRQNQFVDEMGHTTDLITKEVLGWMDKATKPWFYYVPYTAVHVPVQAKKEWLETYKDSVFYKDPVKNESYQRYAAFTSHLDNSIGKLINKVKALGQLENTIIVLVSDNGSYNSWSNINWKGKRAFAGDVEDSPVLGSNLPLRGYKQDVYEGGILTPAFILWEGKIKPGESNNVYHIADWMPTFANLTGYQPTKEMGWDGKDIMPQLLGKKPADKNRTLYWKYPKKYALRQGEYKLIDLDGKQELYNLKQDPYEKNNIINTEKAKAQQLDKMLKSELALDSIKREKYFKFDPEVEYNNMGLD